jgi:predicted nucleic acid-binding protein
MTTFIPDASVTLGWCFGDEKTAYTESLLDRLIEGDEAFVPPHWPLEVLNGIIQGSRHKRIEEPKAQSFLSELLAFHIFIDQFQDLSRLHSIRILAEKHRLTAYDAAYLELAMRKELPLATLDGDLIRAARAEKVLLV